MKKDFVKIDNDNLFITERLKELDESYFIVFNFINQKFEVHSTAQKGDSFCFTVPYTQLDSRTIDYARKTSVTRRDKLIAELDAENEKIEQQQIKLAKDKLLELV